MSDSESGASSTDPASRAEGGDHDRAVVGDGEREEIRVWMVERTYSADSPNILVIVYATPNGSRYVRREWAFNRHGAGDAPTVTAAIDVEAERLEPVADDVRDRYATEAQRMADRHAPDDVV